MASIVDLIREHLREQREELKAGFKILIEDICKVSKEEWACDFLPRKKERLEALPVLHTEQPKQDLNEAEVLELDEKNLNDRSEDLEIEVEQDIGSGGFDTQTFKNYEIVTKAQQERLELIDLTKEKQQDMDNSDQLKILVLDILNVRMYKLRKTNLRRNYVKVMGKVFWGDTENLKELMFLQGEEKNAQSVLRGLEKGLIDLKTIIGQMFKYIFQFDSKD